MTLTYQFGVVGRDGLEPSTNCLKGSPGLTLLDTFAENPADIPVIPATAVLLSPAGSAQSGSIVVADGAQVRRRSFPRPPAASTISHKAKTRL